MLCQRSVEAPLSSRVPQNHCVPFSPLLPLSLLLVLGGCASSASPLPPLSSGPSWSLSKSNGDLSAPRGGTLPTGRSDTSPSAAQPAYVYKGGRDTFTGRAPAQLTNTPTAATPPSLTPPGAGAQRGPQRQAQPPSNMPQAHAPGSLPPLAGRSPPPADAGVRGQTMYRPADANRFADPGGPGVPYAAPLRETVRRGETLNVAPGDTITAIATRHRVSVAEMMRVNALTTPVLQPGQQVRIPQR